VGFRFKKVDRLLKRSDFVSLSRSGKKIHSPSFLAVYQRSLSGRCRLGITVTKRVAHAPGRNRIKRLVRESYRRHRPEFKGCWDINIIAKQRCDAITTAQAAAELADIFKKLTD
jgi:ribonuclease P protein component